MVNVLTTADVSIRRDGPLATLAIAGEIDVANEREVWSLLHPVVVDPPRCLWIDLSGLSLLGSSGLRLLQRLDAVIRAAGGRAEIIAASAQATRMLTVMADVMPPAELTAVERP